jgi:serine/threonine protein kinase
LTHLHTRASHRDLKPENVLIAGTVLKIGDFGLSRLVAASTQAATFKGYGAPHYMAPEVWEENTPTKATDLYAVGIMLFEALTGQLPFEGQDWLALRRQHLHEQPPRVRSLNIGVSGQLDGVVRRLLEKDPLRRFQSASEVSDALIGSPPPTFSEPYCYSNEDPSRWGRSSDISYRAAER